LKDTIKCQAFFVFASNFVSEKNIRSRAKTYKRRGACAILSEFRQFAYDLYT